ncbi:MAG: hypothetical protein HYV93_25800 [Candidatus Rokubacteria bacterium]|nr:hypothetical protein [Candidatus Rokubacteria bacterium]
MPRRFGEYEARIQKLARLVDEGAWGGAFAREVREKEEEYLWALTEGAQLCDVIDFLRASGPGLKKSKVREALAGPAFPTESPGAGTPRGTPALMAARKAPRDIDSARRSTPSPLSPRKPWMCALP